MLETNRLLLRPMTAEDIENVFEMRRDTSIMRFIREPQTDLSEAENWVKLISSRWADEKIGFCAVIEKKSAQFIGWCGLWRLAETGDVEVGYALFKKFWGQGYAAEAAQAFLRYGFGELNLERIVAVADPENKGSRRVMEKIGMRFDGIGKFYGRDLVHYTITREKFAARENKGKLAAN